MFIGYIQSRNHHHNQDRKELPTPQKISAYSFVVKASLHPQSLGTTDLISPQCFAFARI